MVDGALVEHDAIRQGDGVPLWKYYYEARNMLYVNLHLKRRFGHYPRNLSKLVARAVLRGSGVASVGWPSSPVGSSTVPSAGSGSAIPSSPCANGPPPADDERKAG